MVNELPPFHLPMGFLIWLAVIAVCSVVSLLVGLTAAVAAHGRNGPRVLSQTLSRGFRDLVLLSWQRIYAISRLTFKEAWRRKAFMIWVLFLLLFMFAGWFLGESDLDKPARAYITFVMTTMSWLLIPMTLLVSCWGLPADIKARSLHTVVTKPVRRSEIVLGRMLGYSKVVTVVLVATAVLGYVWILRKVPDVAQDQLIGRVPKYGTIRYIDRSGEAAQKLVNVGDIWDYRTYIDGATRARAIWTFENLDVKALRAAGKVRLEQKFEVFRTFKGDVRQQVRYGVTLLNPERNLSVPVGIYPAQEFALGSEDAVIEIPAEIVYQDPYDLNAPEQKVNLFDDLIHGGKLVVEVRCVDSQQYVGVARDDLFIRMPDHSFTWSYVKSSLCLWLMLILLVMIGTTASCFLKGPVATIFTGGLIVVGGLFPAFLQKMLDDVQHGEYLGGGLFESAYRMQTAMNQTSPMPSNMGTDLIKLLDEGVFGMLRVVNALIPNLQYFTTSRFTANGFDVPWAEALLPSLAITAAYFIPLVILGYFSLQLRELEHK